MAFTTEKMVGNTDEKIQDLRNTEVWATLMDNVDDECRDLLDNPSFSLENVQYMSSLPKSCVSALSSNVALMMQEAVEKSLTEELIKFYTSVNQPDKEMHIAKLVQKYGKTTKQKKRLYDKLNKKYPGKISIALKKMLVLPKAGGTKKKTKKKTMNQAETTLENVFDGVQTPMDMLRNLAGISKECMDQLRASQDEGKNYAFSAECRAELTRAEEMVGETKKVDGKKDL